MDHPRLDGRRAARTYTPASRRGRRVPARRYELVSTDLHYNHPMRFELPGPPTPVVAWY